MTTDISEKFTVWPKKPSVEALLQIMQNDDFRPIAHHRQNYEQWIKIAKKCGRNLKKSELIKVMEHSHSPVRNFVKYTADWVWDTRDFAVQAVVYSTFKIMCEKSYDRIMSDDKEEVA